MSTRAARNELAEFKPEGWSGYGYTPGTANLPAMVVGMPDKIVRLSGALRQIDLPVYLVVPLANRDNSERILTDAVDATVELFEAVNEGETVRSVRVVEVDQFVQGKVGQTDVLAATIHLEATVRS